MFDLFYRGKCMYRLIYGVFVVLYLFFSLHFSYVVWVRRPWAAFLREV